MTRALGGQVTYGVQNVDPSTPGLIEEPIPLWQPPKGLDYLGSLDTVDKGYFVQSANLWLDRGRLRSRYGTNFVGGSSAAPDQIMAVVNFIKGNGAAYLIRFTMQTVQLWNGAAWTSIFTGLTGGRDDMFVFTSFGNTLIFSNGVDGLFKYDPDTGVVTQINGGPACRHLTTFNSRVIASNVSGSLGLLPSRIMWSVKDNSDIWPDTTGVSDDDKLGSGFEDLLSSPGGRIDIQRGVWPVNDTTAIVLRSNSVWQMTPTDNFDAPFVFARLYDNIGTDTPYSMDAVPGGVVGLFRDNLYIIQGDGSITPIGDRVKDALLAEVAQPNRVVGMYDPDTRNYWLSDQTAVYRYSLIDQGWTRHTYPWQVRAFHHTKSSLIGLQIDQLSGFSATIDGLSAVFPTIDSMVGARTEQGNFFVDEPVTLGENHVLQEDPTLHDDFDGGLPGARVDSPISVVTQSLALMSPYQRWQLLKAIIQYEALAIQTLLLEYSYDGGVTWFTYSQNDTVITKGPSVLAFRKSLDFQQMQFRLSSTKLGQLTVWEFTPTATRGAPLVQ